MTSNYEKYDICCMVTGMRVFELKHTNYIEEFKDACKKYYVTDYTQILTYIPSHISKYSNSGVNTLIVLYMLLKNNNTYSIHMLKAALNIYIVTSLEIIDSFKTYDSFKKLCADHFVERTTIEEKYLTPIMNSIPVKTLKDKKDSRCFIIHVIIISYQFPSKSYDDIIHYLEQ